MDAGSFCIQGALCFLTGYFYAFRRFEIKRLETLRALCLLLLIHTRIYFQQNHDSAGCGPHRLRFGARMLYFCLSSWVSSREFAAAPVLVYCLLSLDSFGRRFGRNCSRLLCGTGVRWKSCTVAFDLDCYWYYFIGWGRDWRRPAV